MKQVTKEEFDRFLRDHPLATPDGFKINGGFVQTKWIQSGKEIARDSADSQGHIYEIFDL